MMLTSIQLLVEPVIVIAAIVPLRLLSSYTFICLENAICSIAKRLKQIPVLPVK